MAVLYQKYRPKRFSEVIGQDAIVRTLKNATIGGQLAHAYLLTGSRGIGKTSIARIIAKAANCLELQEGDPCSVCHNCSAIAADNFLDVIEIDAASHTGVDNMRELIEHVQFKPTHGRMKVFIIDEVHMLSKAAFNALLKTLEEPPAHAMFILATTDIEKVPDTIVSRTQRFDFRKITPVHMVPALEAIVAAENITIPEGALQLITTNAEGGMRDALSLLDTIAALGTTATSDEVRMLLGLTSIGSVEELIGFIVTHNASNIPAFFDTLSGQGADFTVFNRNVLEYVRLMLVAKVTSSVPTTTMLDDAAQTALQLHADRVSMPQLMFIIRLFLRSYKEIGQAPSPELPLLLASIEASLHGTAATAQVPVRASAAAPAVKSVTETKNGPEAPHVSSVEQSVSPNISPEVVAEVEKIIAPSSPDKLLVNLDSEQAIDQSVENITIEDVHEWWPEVVQRIKTVNSPLSTLLKNSPLKEVSNGKITIAVKYLFHKEHLENTKHMSLILETITGVCGKRLAFRAMIVKDQETPVFTQTVDALTDAIKIFGGELVE